jgi:hypothetical protein
MKKEKKYGCFLLRMRITVTNFIKRYKLAVANDLEFIPKGKNKK